MARPVCGGIGNIAPFAQVGLAQAALAFKAYKNKKRNYPESVCELREAIPWQLREE